MDGPASVLYCFGHSLRSFLDTLHVEVGRLHSRVDGAELEESQMSIASACQLPYIRSYKVAMISDVRQITIRLFSFVTTK